MEGGEIGETGNNVQYLVEEQTIADIAFVICRLLPMGEKIVQEVIPKQRDVMSTSVQVSSLI